MYLIHGKNSHFIPKKRLKKAIFTYFIKEFSKSNKLFHFTSLIIVIKIWVAVIIPIVVGPQVGNVKFPVARSHWLKFLNSRHCSTDV